VFSVVSHTSVLEDSCVYSSGLTKIVTIASLTTHHSTVYAAL